MNIQNRQDIVSNHEVSVSEFTFHTHSGLQFHTQNIYGLRFTTATNSGWYYTKVENVGTDNWDIKLTFEQGDDEFAATVPCHKYVTEAHHVIWQCTDTLKPG